MRLKLRFPTTTEILTLTGADNTDESVSLKQLLDLLSKDGTVNEPSSIRAGFPPKPISLEDPSVTLKSLGISNGESLVVTLEATSPHPKSESSTQSPPRSASLKPTSIPSTFAKSTTSKITKSGKPKSSTLFKSTPNSATPRPTPKPISPDAGIADDVIQVKCSGFGYLRLRVMEDDNSCLFRAVGYTILKNLDSMFSLRDVVRETILNNPDEYSEAILDKPRDVYMSWIMQSNSWGGAIELDILAKNFGITICSLDVASLRTDMFNPGQDRFVCVVYSGIHYDAVALVPSDFESGRPEDDLTIFEGDMKGMQVLESLTELGKVLKERRYYTDTAKFSLKCKICSTALSGEKEATKHAISTGHTDFGEY